MSSPRRPHRILDKTKISEAYPQEIVVDFNNGDLSVITPDGTELPVNNIEVETTGSGNSVTGVSVSDRKITVTKDANYLTEHPEVTKENDGTSSETVQFGKSFTAVDSVTRDENGHVTKINTKSITIPEVPAESDIEVTVNGSGNAVTEVTASGHSVTVTKGATYLTEHPDIAMSTNGTDTADSPSHGGNFSVVSSVTKDDNGHVTKINTKTVNLPTETKLSVESTGNGNAVTNVEVSDHKVTLTKGSSFLTEHPEVTVINDGTSNDTPGYGGTFTAVDSVTRDENGHVTKINTKTVTMPAEQTNITGNAGTATKLKDAFDITVSGAVSGSASNVDGSADVTINTTSVDATKLTGIVPIANLPQGALERFYPVSSDADRLVLTIDDVQNGDVVKVTATGLMYYVKDETKLGTEDAFEPFTAGTASAVDWSGVNNKPNFATVATSGDYNDLSNKPVIPTIPNVAVTETGSGNAVTSISATGHTVTVTKGATYLTEHPDINMGTDNTSTEAPAHGKSFTAIDSISKDDNGHVTKVNTKTVTLPVETNLSVESAGDGNAVTSIEVSGHKVTFNKDNTFLTEHPSVTMENNSTSTETPAFGESFTAIDSVTKDDNGHVTKVNTKTVTLPTPAAETKLSVESTGDGNVVTAIEVNDHKVTFTKGITALTEESPVTITETGSGNAVTSVSATGHTVTVTKNATFLTEHPTVTKETDATYTESPAHGESFTAIDEVVRDANGHVTKVNTKTVTLPSVPEETKMSVESTGNGNVVTGIEVNDHKVTFTKGITALTEETPITITESGSGEVVTSMSSTGHSITMTKGAAPHPTIAVETDTTSNEAPEAGATFTAVDSITRDANGHVTKVNTKTVTLPAKPTATELGCASTVLYTANIGTSWTGTAAPYTQTIAVTGILDTDTPIVDVNLSGVDYSNKDSIIEDYAKVYRITTAANSITVYADEATSVVIPIQLKVIR